MFSLRTRFLLFLSLILIIVLVTWLYAQRSYSTYNVVEPDLSGTPLSHILVTETVVINLAPIFPQISTITATVEAAFEDSGCTLPLEYWLQDKTRIPPQILVNVTTSNQIEACVNYAGSEICAILGEVNNDPESVLKQQFLVAIMNYLYGADPSSIENTINDAYEWLTSHIYTPSITEQDQQDAQLYTQTLQSFNQGDIGPGACEEGIIPITQAESPTSRPTTSITVTISSPTVTNTPTVRRTAIIIVPTSTEVPERPEPTLTSPPPPTDTQPAPTATSPPTATEIPPPTHTDIPTPTPVLEEATPTPVP